MFIFGFKYNYYFSDLLNIFLMSNFKTRVKLKAILCMGLTVLIYFPALNSQKISFNGKIIDQNSKTPLEYATVSVFKSGKIYDGVVTDENGMFKVSAPDGADSLLIEYISYHSKSVNISAFTNDESHDLGSIGLSSDAEVLDGVELIAEKSSLQFNLDKKIFNVGQDISSRSGSAEDVLNNIPSVTVGVEGELSMRGSENVKVLIDGKVSGLTGLSGNTALKSIPASSIEKVEIITNPSARYEAEGMAGIINIILKKERNQGFNGSVDLKAGTPAEYGLGINSNYRSKSVNFFANYAIRYGKAPVRGMFDLRRFSSDTTFVTFNERMGKRGGVSQTFTGGIDWFLTDKSTLTGSITYKYDNDDNHMEVRYWDYTLTEAFNVEELPRNIYSLRTDDEFEHSPSLEYALNYVKHFDQKDRELKMLLQYRDNKETEGSDLNENLFDNQTIIENRAKQRSNNSEGEYSWVGQIDYVHPINKDLKLEAGGRMSLRQIKNSFLVEEQDDFENWFRLDNYSNDFTYNEDVYAAYLIVGQKLNRFSYQLGVRNEYSHIYTLLQQTEEEHDNQYNDLFPSAFLNYEITPSDKVQLSYSSRIQRPSFFHLNPFFTFSDPRNFFSGNPELKPEYTDSYELGYLKYWDQANIGATVYYRQTDDVIFRLTEYNEDGTSIRKPENIATEDSYGIEFLFGYDGIKRLKLDGNFNFFNGKINGENIPEVGKLTNESYTARLNMKWTGIKDIDFQIRYQLRGPSTIPQGTREAMNMVDVAISKELIKDKLTLSFSGRDIFNQRKRVYSLIGENYTEDGEFQWRANSFIFNLNYQFNNLSKKGKGGKGKSGEKLFENNNRDDF